MKRTRRDDGKYYCSLYYWRAGAMAKVYADLIRKGYKTIDDVPAKLREAVQAILDGESNAV